MFDFETVKDHEIFFNHIKDYVKVCKKNNINDREIKASMINYTNYILENVEW